MKHPTPPNKTIRNTMIELSSSTFSLTSAILLGVVTAILYNIFFASTNHNNATRTRAAAARQPSAGQTVSQPQHFSSNISKTPCGRSPPHLLSKAYNNGSNVLNDGVIAFCHTKAASANIVVSNMPPQVVVGGSDHGNMTAVATTTTAVIQKRRAQLLSRLLLVTPSSSTASQHTLASTAAAASSSSTVLRTPPGKGSTISIAVDAQHLQCPHLHEALYLLGTYYNILVIIAVNNGGNDSNHHNASSTTTSAAAGALRQELYDSAAAASSSSSMTTTPQRQLVALQLTHDILPPHRILVASTTAGRVAVVRQLQRVELVLELEVTAQESLARFGHKVIVYGNTNNASKRLMGGSSSSSSRFADLWDDDYADA
jgi:hypothetical protein